MFSTLSVVIIDRDKQSRDAIEDCLKPLAEKVKVVGAVADYQEGMKIIPTAKPHIIVLEVKEIEQGVRETSFFISRFPDTTVIVTAADKNPDWILRLIRAGASEYLIKPVTSTDLVEVFHKLTRFHAQATGKATKKGVVISVYNPCGGMGTTTIAVNLAAALGAQKKKIALIDLNLLNTDVSTFLDLAPRYTLSDITAKTGQIDASFLKSILVPHSSGVHVLNGPADLGVAERMAPEQLQEVIAVLQDMFKYIVVDTGGQLSGCNLATFAYSDHILLTTVLQPPAIGNAKRYLAAMHSEGIGAERIKLVVNRHIPKDELKVADAEKTLNTMVYHIVPNAYAEARTSINKGIPLITCYPRSPVAKAMDELAKKLTLEGQHDKQELPVTESRSWHSLSVFKTPLATDLVVDAGSGSDCI